MSGCLILPGFYLQEKYGMHDYDLQESSKEHARGKAGVLRSWKRRGDRNSGIADRNDIH
jgi:hypothetical protein